MPVNDLHASVTDMLDRWFRCRAAFAGADEIKKARTRFLPALGGQIAGITTGQTDPYAGYLLRAMFYPAMARTVSGLTGTVFGKPPTVAEVPIAQQPEFIDVTLSGVSLAAYAVSLCREVLITGRAGTLVDFPDGVTPGARPYWVTYPAESITNWRTARIGGRQVLTLLVLKEDADVQKADDLFTTDTVTQYRVLRLVENKVVVQVHREDPDHKGTFIAGEERTPLRRGVALSFIPFVFLGPSGTTPDVEHPPLLDLVDVNISHYRTSADREHSGHWTALPTAVLTGHTLAPGERLTIGSGDAWVLPNPQATATYLEFSGAGMGALKDLMEEKRLAMITLGARMMETQKNTQEAAQTVRLRHAGESSTMGIIATALGQALTQAIRWHLWWGGLDETTANKALFTLNPDVMDELTADDVRALVTSWQAGAISQRTVLANLIWGSWLPEGTTIDQELDNIKREGDNLDLPKPLPGAAA